MENNTPLTKKGLKQAKAVAQRLKNYEFDEIFCSDLTRAKQTCEEYLKLTNKKANYTEDLREVYRVIVGGHEKEGTSEGRKERDRKREKNKDKIRRERKRKTRGLFGR